MMLSASVQNSRGTLRVTSLSGFFVCANALELEPKFVKRKVGL
ncbi:hypothetical protein [Caudoviricetes sp.]|nr:hypothetical protein [Caudoviricetes sp.]